jgi:hypothetical protein
MRANANLFWMLSLFFGIISVVYALWTMFDYQGNPLNELKNETGVEWAGTVALALSSVLATFLAFYLTITQRAQGGELPEDRLDAVIDDGDPEVGQFSPWSWWPVTLGFGLGLVFLGLAVGIWIALIGAPVVLVAIIGWNYEYFRGNFAR